MARSLRFRGTANHQRIRTNKTEVYIRSEPTNVKTILLKVDGFTGLTCGCRIGRLFWSLESMAKLARCMVVACWPQEL